MVLLLNFQVMAGRSNSSESLRTFFRSEKYFSANCILPSVSMVLSLAISFFTSERVEEVLISTPSTTMVLFCSYSTMVAWSMLKAYRAASSRVTALEPTNSSLPSSRPIPTACLITATFQLAPVYFSMELS